MDVHIELWALVFQLKQSNMSMQCIDYIGCGDIEVLYEA